VESLLFSQKLEATARRRLDLLSEVEVVRRRHAQIKKQ